MSAFEGKADIGCTPLARSGHCPNVRQPVAFFRFFVALQQEKSMAATDAAAGFPYAVHLDIKFDALDRIDVPSLVEACTDQWYNQTLCKVNDSVVRLGVMQGDTSTITMTSSFSCSAARSSSIWRAG